MSPPVPTSLVRVTPLIVRFKEGRGRWSVEQIKSSFLNVLCRDFAVFDVYTVDSLTLSLPRFRSLSHFKEREESSASRGLPMHRPPWEVRERKRKRKKKITGEIGQSGAFEEKKDQILPQEQR